MLQRLYIHNFKTFQNFEWKLADTHSCLLIGRNGAGKSSVAQALQVLQKIGQGSMSTRDLLDKNDWFSHKTIDAPLRIEVDIGVEGKNFKYSLAFTFPDAFEAPKILEESLFCNAQEIFSRKEALVTFKTSKINKSSEFSLDWHKVALPIIQSNTKTDPVSLFRDWLSNMLILAPIPKLMIGEAVGNGGIWLNQHADNFVTWLSRLISHYPATYALIDKHLKTIIPDFESMQFIETSKRLVFNFTQNKNRLNVDFEYLSDGEKCFVLFATVIATNKIQGPLFCFWDEPDNYLTLSEVSYFIRNLRSQFEDSGQIIMTSHNSEAIHGFSANNIWVLNRHSHIEPSQIRLSDEFPLSPNGLIDDLTTGEFWHDK